MYFLFNRTTLQVFVTYLTGALYMHPLRFYKNQQENRVRSKLFVASHSPFAAILVNCAPSGEMNNYSTPHITKENFDNFLIHRCSCILLSKCIVYDKLLKPRQSFLIKLYFVKRCSLILIGNIFRPERKTCVSHDDFTEIYESWNFNSGNYLFTTDTK